MHLLPGKRFTTLNTIYHADAMDMLACLPDGSVDLVLTDPPYGVTQNKWGVMPDLELFWQHIKRIAKPRAAIVITACQPFTSLLVVSNLEMFRYEWVWRKGRASNFLDARRKPMRIHESALVFGSSLPAYYPQMTAGDPYTTTTGSKTTNYGKFNNVTIVNTGERYPLTVIEFANETGMHPTQKPVALFEYLIKTYTQEGDVVLDPYMGSGTTAVAAMRTGRQFVGSEMDATYHALATKRLQDTDPYQPTVLKDGSKQLSLFAEQAS
jgi:site-specific DNA-methyltransferase (adenine-specific)